MPKIITCNKCGNKFDMWDETEGVSVHKPLGFGTKYDGCYLKLNICCKCLETLIDKCVISPLISNT